VLLLSRALLTELTNDLLPKPRGLGEHFIEAIKHLFQVFRVDWSTVGHSCRKDYGINRQP